VYRLSEDERHQKRQRSNSRSNSPSADLTSSLVREIRHNKSGSVVNSGWLQVVKVERPKKYDDNEYQYIQVKSEKIPTYSCRLKVTLPLEDYIPKKLFSRGT